MMTMTMSEVGEGQRQAHTRETQRGGAGRGAEREQPTHHLPKQCGNMTAGGVTQDPAGELCPELCSKQAPRAPSPVFSAGVLWSLVTVRGWSGERHAVVGEEAGFSICSGAWSPCRPERAARVPSDAAWHVGAAPDVLHPPCSALSPELSQFLHLPQSTLGPHLPQLSTLGLPHCASFTGRG